MIVDTIKFKYSKEYNNFLNDLTKLGLVIQKHETYQQITAKKTQLEPVPLSEYVETSYTNYPNVNLITTKLLPDFCVKIISYIHKKYVLDYDLFVYHILNLIETEFMLYEYELYSICSKLYLYPLFLKLKEHEHKSDHPNQ